MNPGRSGVDTARVMTGEGTSAAAYIAAAEDPFAMANLFPRSTGLPMTIWVSPRGAGRHAQTLKVNLTHGDQATPANAAVVGVRPWPHLVAGQLSPGDQAAVFRWISLNAGALAAYWGGQFDTVELGRRLKPLT